MNRPIPVIEPHQFDPTDYVGGDPALDFVNTVTARDGTPRDWLDSYATLLDWAEGAKLLPSSILKSLARRAKAEPAAAAAALARAKALREAAFDLVAALAAHRPPPVEALALVQKGWAAGVEAHELQWRDGRVVVALDEAADDLDLPAAIVAWRLVEHVLPVPLERLRMCAGPDCSWLFIDRSKANRRRWCDMADCGNVAKSRRFQARRRRQSARR